MTEPLSPGLRSVLVTVLDLLVANDVPGIGVDIENHSRWETGDLRLDALFTPAERARCEQLARPAAQLAGTWSAKEAAVKAMSPFVTLSLRDVEIVHEPDGRPAIRILAPGLQEHGGRVRVSISRTEQVSVAVAIYLPPAAVAVDGAPAGDVTPD